MRLVKYNPEVPFRGIDKVIDHFFNRGIGDFLGGDFLLTTPSVNVVEAGDGFRIELAAPGLKKEDFEVNVENGALRISAGKKEESEQEEGKFTRREFNYASFERTFQLPETVAAEKIEAKYNDGILTISIPKVAEAKAEAKTIQVK